MQDLRGDYRGFTLLEIMVAVSLLAIVLTAVYRLHSQTISMNAAARFYSMAPFLAQTRLAQIESNPDEIGLGGSGDFGQDFPGYAWTETIEELRSENLEKVLGETAADFKKIDIAVSYNSGEYNYTTRTYRMLPAKK
jgi:general secretion pathway protein I